LEQVEVRAQGGLPSIAAEVEDEDQNTYVVEEDFKENYKKTVYQTTVY